ncbi:sensor histidine kinase [Arcanobacterium wilhelmae]|uniref:sensor histidine kinase n=1 Tax=Arcanobacterium wilhelmae TaxID=1803177 RepID=UPI002414D2C4|nr:sensor histidine kinase [Arcanobacterium wilhelmae]WFN89832.1 sensor histidine kinase [Arcanobacterium wilhelmae]
MKRQLTLEEPTTFVTVKGVSPLDAMLALMLAVFYIDSFSTAAATWGALATFALLIVGITTSCATIFRRTSPVRSAGIVYISALVRFLVAPTDLILPDLAVLLALWAVVAYGPSLVRYLAIITTLMAGILITIARVTILSGTDLAVFLILIESVVIMVAATATIRRFRIERIHHVVHQANRAQREAEREAELAVAEERNRIARDMHDVVAHTLTTVIAQADGGRYAAKTNPAAAEKTLDLISSVSREALSDIRAIIGVLRAGDDPASPRHPQPGVDDIPSLFDQVRELGHGSTYTVSGTPSTLPTGVGTALFRIAQEAITNSLKYGGENVAIDGTLTWARNEVTLAIVDDGPGVSVTDGRGHGIIGMHERAGAFGGTVNTGAGERGGFRVTATFPTN